MTDYRPVLGGIRVLDFGRYIAGPFCAALLGDMGADVIRVERIGGGEDREMYPLGPDGIGAIYLSLNRNKRSIAVDLSSLRGQQILGDLVRTADIVVANLPPSVLRSLRLDLLSLRAIKPDIILTTVSAFGSGGPDSDRHGFDGTGQAMSGAAYLSGTIDQPIKTIIPWVDFGTASLAAFGTMAALMARPTAGGQQVEASLLRTAVAFANPMLIEQQVLGINRHPTINRLPTAAPSDLFRTKDGWIIVQVIGNKMFRRWAELVGEREWVDDSRFADDIRRGDHGDLISKRMTEWTLDRTSDEAIAALSAVNIPAAPVYSPQEALDDPHIRAASIIWNERYPGIDRPVPLAPTPVELSTTRGTYRMRAPGVGEHTTEILLELGYSTDAITGLRAGAVIQAAERGE